MKSPFFQFSDESGYVELKKEGGRWKKLFCRLSGGSLTFYTSSSAKQSSIKLCLWLQSTTQVRVVTDTSKKGFRFAVTIEGKEYFLRVKSAFERQRWINSINEACPQRCLTLHDSQACDNAFSDTDVAERAFPPMRRQGKRGNSSQVDRSSFASYPSETEYRSQWDLASCHKQTPGEGDRRLRSVAEDDEEQHHRYHQEQEEEEDNDDEEEERSSSYNGSCSTTDFCVDDIEEDDDLLQGSFFDASRHCEVVHSNATSTCSITTMQHMGVSAAGSGSSSSSVCFLDVSEDCTRVDDDSDDDSAGSSHGSTTLSDDSIDRVPLAPPRAGATMRRRAQQQHTRGSSSSKGTRGCAQVPPPVFADMGRDEASFLLCRLGLGRRGAYLFRRSASSRSSDALVLSVRDKGDTARHILVTNTPNGFFLQGFKGHNFESLHDIVSFLASAWKMELFPLHDQGIPDHFVTLALKPTEKRQQPGRPDEEEEEPYVYETPEDSRPIDLIV